MALLQESVQPEVSIAVLEDLIEWVRLEKRVRHVFLDLKLTPEQSDTAVSLLTCSVVSAPARASGTMSYFACSARKLRSSRHWSGRPSVPCYPP